MRTTLAAIVPCVLFATVAAAQSSPATKPASEPRTYYEFQVEKAVSPRDGNAGPTYPAKLRSINVEGEVLVQFVVDTTGLPEMASFKVLKSSHDDFTEAVRVAIAAMKFHAAEIKGRPVRQVVQQPFNFELSR